MKICLICSPGGHLIEGLKLMSAAEVDDEIVLITQYEDFALNIPRIYKIYYVKNFLVKRVNQPKPIKFLFTIYSMIYLFFKELKILIIEKPDIIVSTGSEIAIPAFLISKLLRIKTIFVESLTRITELSGTGKILLKIANIFLVQWEFLSKKYENVIFKGNILEMIETPDISGKNDSKEPFIFVTVGTASFPRLVKIMDNIAEVIPEKVVIQRGRTDYKPQNADYFDFTANLDEFNHMNQKAKIIVSHAGVGNVINVLEHNNNLVIFPRLEEYKEHIDDHQLEFAKFLEKAMITEMACSKDDIYNFIIKGRQEKEENYNMVNNQLDLMTFLKKAFNSDKKV
jgi:UDP-N-acetylglucosamine transferase subunit ALG13